MFFAMKDIDFASYADDNTPYVSSDSIEDVIKILENDSIKLFKWFSDNIMKANKDKCQHIVSSNEHVSMKLDNTENENSNCERLLGVKIDSKLNFKENLDGIIKKASRNEYWKTETIDDVFLRVTLSCGFDHIYCRNP